MLNIAHVHTEQKETISYFSLLCFIGETASFMRIVICAVALSFKIYASFANANVCLALVLTASLFMPVDRVKWAAE